MYVVNPCLGNDTALYDLIFQIIWFFNNSLKGIFDSANSSHKSRVIQSFCHENCSMNCFEPNHLDFNFMLLNFVDFYWQILQFHLCSDLYRNRWCWLWLHVNHYVTCWLDSLSREKGNGHWYSPLKPWYFGIIHQSSYFNVDESDEQKSWNNADWRESEIILFWKGCLLTISSYFDQIRARKLCLWDYWVIFDNFRVGRRKYRRRIHCCQWRINDNDKLIDESTILNKLCHFSWRIQLWTFDDSFTSNIIR